MIVSDPLPSTPSRMPRRQRIGASSQHAQRSTWDPSAFAEAAAASVGGVALQGNEQIGGGASLALMLPIELALPRPSLVTSADVAEPLMTASATHSLVQEALAGA